MRGPHNIFRLARAGATFRRTGALKIALDSLNAPASFKFAARTIVWPFAMFGIKGDQQQTPILRTLVALGPAWIKFGQLLSTRPDVVGKDIADELRVLRDRLPPFPTEQAKQIVETELDIDIESVFSEFDEPIAAASVAQVHRAKLRECGTDVAVKVIRPGIERAFQKDIDAFHFLAWLAMALSPPVRRLRPPDVVTHFESVVNRELDLRMEASAADEFAKATADDEGVSVPAILWAHSSKHVLTFEWKDGIDFGDVDDLKAAGHNLPSLAERMIQIFLRQALRDGYFHADMHQGNLMVSKTGDIILLDFGIMGRIDSYTRRVYAEIIMGFIRRDYRRVAEVHFEAGYVPPDRDIDDFAQALRSVGEPIFGMEADKISMGRLLSHLFEVTERFGMKTRTELILLQRTMVVVEGVARTLDPKLNMWTAARPVVEDYIRSHIGPASTFREIASAARAITRLAPRIHNALEISLSKFEADSKAGKPGNSFGFKAFFLGVIAAVAVIAVASAL